MITTTTVNCSGCRLNFEKKSSHVKYSAERGQKNFYCTLRCRNDKRLAQRIQCSCAECGKILHRAAGSIRHKRQYCTRKCATIAKNKTRIGEAHPNWNGGTGYRVRALRHYGRKCTNESCSLRVIGLMDERMLDVHHRDKNRRHNEISNLEVLCVWCHAKKTRGVF